jgi:hypothetical protein
MILVLVFFVLLISLIGEVFHYFRVKANAFTKAEVRRSANEQAQKLTYEDPIISCDYCGAKIDTRYHKTCPQCGGAFDKDIEWLVRHDVKDEFVDKGTAQVISEREEKAAEEGRKILAKIKVRIIALAALILGFFVIGVMGFLIARGSEFRQDEKLNSKSYEHYIESDYAIDGDGILINEEDLKLTLTGIYREERIVSYGDETPYCDVKLAFHVENNTGKNIRLSVHSNTLNGISSDSSYLYMYDYVKKGADITFYERIIHVDYGNVSQIVFEEVEAYSEDYSYKYSSEGPVVVNTTCDYVNEIDLSDYTSIFSNDLVDVYSCAEFDSSDERRYRIILINKTTEQLMLEAGDIKVDGETVNAYGFRKATVMPGGTFRSSQMYSYDDRFQYAGPGTDITMNISVKCENDPTIDFSTGYIKLK